MGCDCPQDRTDGMPPCETYQPHQRPDGVYCDCGHDRTCHPITR